MSVVFAIVNRASKAVRKFCRIFYRCKGKDFLEGMVCVIWDGVGS